MSKNYSIPLSPTPKRQANITNTDLDLTICDPPIESSSTETSEIEIGTPKKTKTMTSNDKYEQKVKEIKKYIAKEMKRLNSNKKCYILSENLQQEITSLSLCRGCPIHSKMVKIGLIT